eukprot:12035710-Alexandrium_andersonii.AAC.1
MLARDAIRLNPQSALWKMQHRFRRSNLELRGPKSGLRLGPRSCQGVNSALFLAQMPILPTNTEA